MKEALKLSSIVIGIFIVLYALVYVASAGVTTRVSTNNPRELITYTFFSATTTSATSTTHADDVGGFKVPGAKKITFYFTHGGAATTSTSGARFTVQISPNGTDWYDYNKLVHTDVSSTATSSITVSGATTTVYASMNILNDTFLAVRCASNELTNLGTAGEHTCTAQAEF